MQLAKAVANARGQWLAKDKGDGISKAYVDSVCPLEEEVDEAHFRAECERQRRRVLEEGHPGIG